MGWRYYLYLYKGNRLDLSCNGNKCICQSKIQKRHNRKYDISFRFRTIFEFIESWYNNTRIHGSLDYKTPNQNQLSLLIRYFNLQGLPHIPMTGALSSSISLFLISYILLTAIPVIYLYNHQVHLPYRENIHFRNSKKKRINFPHRFV